MIKAFQDILYALFDISKVNPDSDFVQFFTFNENIDDPVVAMRTGTVPWVPPQGVSRGKVRFGYKLRIFQPLCLQFYGRCE